MARVLVSLVSEQTLPNYLFIKEFGNETDLFLFVTTTGMEDKNKTQSITKTAGIDKKKIRKILIHEDQLFLVKTKLAKLGWENSNHSYLVNLTGGTKLMALSVYEYFKHFNSRFFYLPYGKNTFKEIYTNKEAVESPLKYNISVDSYFALLGIKFQDKEPILTREQCNRIFEIFSLNGFHLNAFPKNYLKRYFIKNKISFNEESYKPGDWFEEFIFYLIKEKHDLKNSQIKMGLKLYSSKMDMINLSNFDNEIDIGFVNNNTLYTMEAKVSIGKERPNITTLTNTLYKIAAVNRGFGLKPQSALVTLSDFRRLHPASKEKMYRRCEVIGINKPIGREQIISMFNELK